MMCEEDNFIEAEVGFERQNTWQICSHVSNRLENLIVGNEQQSEAANKVEDSMNPGTNS